MGRLDNDYNDEDHPDNGLTGIKILLVLFVMGSIIYAFGKPDVAQTPTEETVECENDDPLGFTILDLRHQVFVKDNGAVCGIFDGVLECSDVTLKKD